MSEKLRKAIGYGFTDLKTANGQIIDPRIDIEGLKSLKTETLGDYLMYIEALELSSVQYHGTDLMYRDMLRAYLNAEEYEEKIKTPLSELFTLSLTDPIIGNVFCVTPASFSLQWIRTDDRMDVLERMLRMRTGSSVVEIESNHYPFDGGYTDRNTGKQLRGFEVMDFKYAVRMKEYSRAAKTAESMGFKTVEEASTAIIPQIPDDVKILCQFTEILTDPKHLYDMKPLYVTMVSTTEDED